MNTLSATAPIKFAMNQRKSAKDASMVAIVMKDMKETWRVDHALKALSVKLLAKNCTEI